MKPRFVWVTDASRVTVGELRRTVDQVDAEVTVILQENEPILAVHPGDLARASASDLLEMHLERLTPLKDTAPEGSAGPARVAVEAEFAVVIRHGVPLLVPTPGMLHWSSIARSAAIEAYAAMAQLPGQIPEPPDPQIRCSCENGDIVWGPASDPPQQCANGHPVICR